ncbi:T9SS type A sorting domain-containing protein [Flavobacterium sp.]|uniref:T9SS type A sorting domain-containing protein n=1 Tax=Flavobacterium sp. TaxID=239 RepID=UPI00286C5CB5|nr:T9SS type A sorting domain-containing protein [Flavobacterium sp.]
MKINFTLLCFCFCFLMTNSENVSAQCSIQNAPASTTTAYAAGFGQTFIPTCTDVLKTVSVTFLPGSFVSSDATLKVMTASNIVLATLTGQYVGPGEITYDFSAFNITLTQGNSYTFDMYRTSLSGQLSTTISIGTYADGAFYEYDEQNNYAYFSNMFDVLFRVNLGTPLSNSAFETSKNSSIYPNPTQGVFNINAAQSINTIAIYDLLGNLILVQNSNADTVDLTSFKSGVYFCKIHLDNGAVETKKVIRE